jgi:hypothetical protein
VAVRCGIVLLARTSIRMQSETSSAPRQSFACSVEVIKAMHLDVFGSNVTDSVVGLEYCADLVSVAVKGFSIVHWD